MDWSIACKRPWASKTQEPRPWREALLALAHQTPRGLWTVEARLLYDLQKVCVDQGRTISTVDVMHWILSLGRRPIRRELPNQRLVLVSRHLRSAQRRLARVRISDRQRRQLAEVLGRATAEAETRLRDDLRPKIAATLDDVGLVPQNLPEEDLPRQAGRRAAWTGSWSAAFSRSARSATPSRGTSSRSPIAPVRGASSAATPPCG